VGLWDSIKNAPGKVIDLVTGDDDNDDDEKSTPTPAPAANVGPYDMVGVGPDGKPLPGDSVPSQVVNPYDPTGELGITNYPAQQNSQVDPNEIIGVGVDGRPSTVNGPASQAGNPYDPTGELGITNYPGKSTPSPSGGTSSTYTAEDYSTTSVPEGLASLAIPQTGPSEYQANSDIAPPSGVGTLGQLLLEISPPGTKFEGQTTAGADGSTTTEWNVVLPGQDPSYWGRTQHVPLVDGTSVDINYGANGAPILTEGEGEPALRLRLADDNGAPRWAVLNAAGERLFTIDAEGNRIGGSPNHQRPGILGIADKAIDDVYFWNPIAKGASRVGFNALVGVGAMVGLWDDLPSALALPTQKQAFEGLTDTGESLLREYLYLRGNAKDDSGNTIYSPDGQQDQQQATLTFYNNVSKALIDTDWSQFKDKPFETLGSAGAGITLLVAPGPRGMNALGKGAHLPEGFGGPGIHSTAPELPWTQLVEPISPAIPEVLAPSIRPDIPNGFDSGVVSPRSNPGGGLVDPAGVGGPTFYDPANPGFPGSTRPRPGDNIPRRGLNPSDHGGGNRAEPPLDQSDYAIPWMGRPEDTPLDHWPVGVRERANDQYWIDVLTGHPVKMAPWAKGKGGQPQKVDPLTRQPKPSQSDVEMITPPRERGDMEPAHNTPWTDAEGQSHPPNTFNLTEDPKRSPIGGFIGDALTRASLKLKGYEIIAAGEGAKIPIPGTWPPRYFKPDFIVRDPVDGKLILIESKFNDSKYQLGQLFGYPQYAAGERVLNIDVAVNPDLAAELLRRDIDPNEAIVKGVETYRWNKDWVPSDELVYRAANDPGFGTLVRDTKDPEWRDSALSAYAELNGEAARRAVNSEDWGLSFYYYSRKQAIELAKAMPADQNLLEGLVLSTFVPELSSLVQAAPVVIPSHASLHEVSLSSDVSQMIPSEALSYLGLRSEIQLRHSGRSVRQNFDHLFKIRADESLSINIELPMALLVDNGAETSALYTHSAHMRI
jgi:hypothetical protein